MKITIPGFGSIEIGHIVCDYNGTLAVDGHVKDCIKQTIQDLSREVQFHVITADTFGLVEKQLEGVNCTLTIIPKGNQAQAKADFIRRLGPDHVIAVGNGVNDKLMLSVSRIGIAVLLEEGTSVSAMMAADILVKDIINAFEYLKNPERLVATLRNG